MATTVNKMLCRKGQILRLNQSVKSTVLLYRVATRPEFPGMSRISAMLSRVPARPAPGRQMSRISMCSQNDNNNKVVIGVIVLIC